MRLTNVHPLLIIFVLGFSIRALPEILSGPYPVGYDLLAGYAPALWAFPDDAPMRAFGWAWSPLTIYILWFFWKFSGVDLYVYLKFAGPIFYGLFVSSFYYLLLKGLGWSEKKSFVTALIFLLQPAVLRTGWDQLREELGFVFLFVLLAKTRCNVVGSASSKPLLVVILSFLIVFSHQLVAILFFVIVLWQLFDPLIKRNFTFGRALLCFVPSALIFVWQLHGQFVSPNLDPRFISIQLPKGTGTFVFTNYFLGDPRFLEGDYLKVLSYVGSLSLYTVIPLVPLTVKGFFKDKVFTPILIWLCITSYTIVVYPWYAFSEYYWWILLLPIPLTVYLGEGLDRLRVFAAGRLCIRRLVFWATFLLLVLLAFGYATSLVKLGYPNAYTYMPSGLVESSVAFTDIPDIENAFIWLNHNAPFNTTILVPEKFQGIAVMTLRSDFRIVSVHSLLTLDNVIKKTQASGLIDYSVYYLDEVDGISNVEILAKFGRVGVFRTRA